MSTSSRVTCASRGLNNPLMGAAQSPKNLLEYMSLSSFSLFSKTANGLRARRCRPEDHIENPENARFDEVRCFEDA